MSWSAYLTNIKGGSCGQCDKACIIGKDGSVWTPATDEGAMNISAQEAQNIARCFQTSDFSQMQSAGVHAEGIKYQFLRGEENMVLAKKKGEGALSMQASKTAIVIGHTKEAGQQGNTNKSVGDIANYLESVNM